MEPQLVDGLRRRRVDTKARWIALLHVEPVTTPLANPGTLAFMIDDSLDAVFSVLGEPRHARPNRAPIGSDSRNPFIAYFLAGKQALLEALVLAETEAAELAETEAAECNREQRDAAVAELTSVIESVIGGEVNAFGQVCHPGSANNGRARTPATGAGAVNEFAG